MLYLHIPYLCTKWTSPILLNSTRGSNLQSHSTFVSEICTHAHPLQVLSLGFNITLIWLCVSLFYCTCFRLQTGWYIMELYAHTHRSDKSLYCRKDGKSSYSIWGGWYSSYINSMLPLKIYPQFTETQVQLAVINSEQTATYNKQTMSENHYYGRYFALDLGFQF